MKNSGARVPDGAREVIRALEGGGYEAYLVGGCVRDMLLGAATHDWDICTNAAPEAIRRTFAQRRTLDVGARHGTVTVLMPDGPYEVTTYRVDGTYSDGRHPDSVAFTGSLTEDLARRDFTINAMALPLDAAGVPAEVVDPFGGREDLRRRALRCVGEPTRRFREDALRILRAIRFASRLELTVEPATRAAMLAERGLLRRISAERVFAELAETLLTERGWEYLREYRDVLAVILPELEPCFDVAQNNPWHCCDVFEHAMRSVGCAPRELTVRLAMLLHDVGKPACATRGEDGVDHFYGHQELSAKLAESALARLRCPNRLIRDVSELVRLHDVPIEPTERAIRRLLNRLGEEQARRLLRVKRADTLAQSEMAQARKLDELERCGELLEKALAERQAFALRDLAISGNDLLAAGVAPGPEVGKRLQRALDAVLDGTAPNEREALLTAALAPEDSEP